MSQSAQITSEQLKELIDDEMKTDQGAREVQEQVEDGEEDLDPENTSSVVNTVPNTLADRYDEPRASLLERQGLLMRLTLESPLKTSVTDA